ncbi:DoxX family protein [Ornithinimicrobium avium]|uniref:DoxX family protein n=1 Tax=Ornithinimicrobium avium TaxID=2283195 RepID=A0A345NMF7_9MICO|nr:DoxX family protein [Ornithinimicrobium avium]AXH96215.1 DoxX family protein [Ornithinimicrobium avium]
MLRRAAQIALGIPFVYLGYQAAAEPGARVDAAASVGLPEPELMVRANGAAMVAGGAALVANVLPRTAAAGLVVSLVPTTLAGHRFWDHEDAAARAGQRIQFLKNLGLAGGLLAVATRRR